MVLFLIIQFLTPTFKIEPSNLIQLFLIGQGYLLFILEKIV